MLAGVMSIAPATAQSGEDSSKERPIMERLDREIPRTEPVSFGGIRYETVRNPRMRGFGQAGGVIAAIDEKSGAELWALVVYHTPYDAAEERDTQDVFITQLRIAEDGKHLEVINERRQKFLVSLSDRSVTALP
jgi:hypothetical protein